MKKIGKVLWRIFADKFVCEEGVCRWHMTDEQINSDQKDEQKRQVIFQESRSTNIHLIYSIMTEEDIVKQVKAIIVDKLGVEESEVTESANFTNDLGADSLDTVELLMEFERVFGIKIPDEETSTIATVKDAIDKVKEKLAGKEEA